MRGYAYFAAQGIVVTNFMSPLLKYRKCEYELLHYLVVLPVEVGTPSAISAGIEVWSWIISEKPDIEVAFMSEVVTAWSDTIKHERGLFSTSLK